MKKIIRFIKNNKFIVIVAAIILFIVGNSMFDIDYSKSSYEIISVDEISGDSGVVFFNFWVGNDVIESNNVGSYMCGTNVCWTTWYGYPNTIWTKDVSLASKYNLHNSNPYVIQHDASKNSNVIYIIGIIFVLGLGIVLYKRNK